MVNSDRDGIWDRYLTSFPKGSDPIFRKRSEHDCSCCRYFIRSVGNVVAVQNGALASVWDLNGLPEHYQTVADSMSDYVKSLPIRDVFLTDTSKVGTPHNMATIEGATQGVIRFNHFSVEVPSTFVARDRVEKCGNLRTTHAVLMRGFKELLPEAVETVAGLIADNAIYRATRELGLVQHR